MASIPVRSFSSSATSSPSPEEGAQRHDGHAASPTDDLVAVQFAVIRRDEPLARGNLRGRNADGHGVLGLAHAPIQHGEILLPAGRSQIDQIRNVPQQRNVEETEVRNVVHRRQRAPENQQHGRIAVDAKGPAKADRTPAE